MTRSPAFLHARRPLLALASACCLLAAGAAQAQPVQETQRMTRAQHSAAEETIKADYKAAEKQCDAFSGNRKDVCEKEAEGRRDVALAQLENDYKPSVDNARKVREAQAKADHEVADEKCEDFDGDAKDRCEKQAQADYDAAKAAIR